MSATYTQWCKLHGEWDMDIDNISECPDCIRLGLTEIQQLRNELANLKDAFTRLKEDRDMHSGMRQDMHKQALRLLAEKLDLERELAEWKTKTYSSEDVAWTGARRMIADLEHQLAIRCGCQFHKGKPIIECGYHQGWPR